MCVHSTHGIVSRQLTGVQAKNIVKIIYSRGRLMSKATGGDFRISEKLVEELKEYGGTLEETLRIIRRAEEDWLHAGLSSKLCINFSYATFWKRSAYLT